MINLTNSAKKCLDKYLQQMRTYLRGCRTVDADEVERNVIEHIESEFESATAAVSFEELDSVLQRLGSPRQWIPEEELPWWRKIIFSLRTGPEDWRLAYISFGLLVVGFIILPSFIVLIPASFIVARAALSEATDSHELKSQKWLIYPSLIIVYSFVLFWLLAWPAFALTNGKGSPFVGLGLWWIILGGLLLKWQSFLQVLFKPFAGWFNRKWALVLLLIGLGLMVPSLGFGIWYYWL